MGKTTEFEGQPTVRELIECLSGYDQDSVVTIASGEVWGGGDAIKMVSEVYATPILRDPGKDKAGLPQEVPADFRLFTRPSEGTVKVVFVI